MIFDDSREAETQAKLLYMGSKSSPKKTCGGSGVPVCFGETLAVLSPGCLGRNSSCLLMFLNQCGAVFNHCKQDKAQAW